MILEQVEAMSEDQIYNLVGRLDSAIMNEIEQMITDDKSSLQIIRHIRYQLRLPMDMAAIYFYAVRRLGQLTEAAER